MSRFRGATAIVGIGQTPYYKRGTAPEPAIAPAMRAIVAACEDAGVSPRDIDGFVSYGSERNSGQKLMAGLGTRELRHTSLVWTHGGGIPGAIGLAAAAILSEQADMVVVYRAMSEAHEARLQAMVTQGDAPAQQLVNGIDIIQRCALRTQRMIEYDGVPRETLETLAMVDYYHANRNPHAVGFEQRLDHETYQNARDICTPYRLFDCSRENDGGAAVLLVSAERARDLRQKPAFILSAPTGSAGRWGSRENNREPYASAGFESVAKRLWDQSGYTANDVHVAQIYENFTGMGVAALIDHGFCTAKTAGEVLTFDNLIAPSGRLPINTSGGNLADGFIHGMGLVPEAVRQIRGTSPNQVPGAALSLMTGGPGDSVVSSALLGSSDTL